jgi:hypothetical protein
VRREGLFWRSGGLFLLTFFTFVTFLLLVICISYFLLLKGVRFVTFLLLVTFINYFLLLRRARVKGFIHCATGERVQLDFFPSFFYC